MSRTLPNILVVEPSRTVAEVLARLRKESFDAVVAPDGPRFEALVLARALRGAGDETPLALLGIEDEAAREAGADFGLEDSQIDELGSRLMVAIARHRARRERRLALAADQRRIAAEESEIAALADQQHELLAALRGVAGPDVRRYVAADQPASNETAPARAA